MFAKLVEIILLFFRKEEKVLSEYEQNSLRQYSKLQREARYNVGKTGELLTYKLLKGFEKDGGRILTNVYVPRENAESTEIDLLLIHKSGIFVFESKNYSGWIFGNENSKYWTQCLTQGPKKTAIKTRFLNPVYQNELHIKYLGKMLNDYAIGEYSKRMQEELMKENIIFFERKLEKKVPIHSLVVFSERCVFKDVKANIRNTRVLKREELLLIMKIIIKNNENILNEKDIEWIYKVLLPYSNVSEHFKQMHVENVQKRIEKK